MSFGWRLSVGCTPRISLTLRVFRPHNARLIPAILERVSGSARQPIAPIRALALALLVALSLAPPSRGSCVIFRSPDRDLWVEVVTCSDQVLQEVADELFLQALGRTDQDWTGSSVRRATALLRETPGLLIVARELAFADSALAFAKTNPQGTFETAYSDRPAVWQSAGTQPERRFFLGSAEATCEELTRGKRIVVREVLRCCDTGRGPELGCILQVPELISSAKAPPAPEELAAAEPAERRTPL